MNIREDKIYLHKRCFEHGGFEALVYGDAQAYLQASAILHRGWAFQPDPDSGSYAFDRAATPRCWRVLFDNRSDTRISRLHFAVAGINAHINFDLALAVVSTCARLGVDFGEGDQRNDYLGVNQILLLHHHGALCVPPLRWCCVL